MENEPPDLPPAPISIFRTRENFELFPPRVTTFEPLIRESLIKKKIEKNVHSILGILEPNGSTWMGRVT